MRGGPRSRNCLRSHSVWQQGLQLFWCSFWLGVSVFIDLQHKCFMREYKIILFLPQSSRAGVGTWQPSGLLRTLVISLVIESTNWIPLKLWVSANKKEFYASRYLTSITRICLAGSLQRVERNRGWCVALPKHYSYSWRWYHPSLSAHSWMCPGLCLLHM